MLRSKPYVHDSSKGWWGGRGSGVVAPSKTVQGTEDGKPDNNINLKKT